VIARSVRVLSVLLIALTFSVTALSAQTPTASGNIDYELWSNTAQRAEGAVDAGRASDTALEALRDELAGWRDTFLEGQSVNNARIETLDQQRTALGPAPAEGETEPAEIADRRAELNAQLADLRAPRLRAEEAYSRADGIIGEIDQIIRERQTNRLFALGPSPLQPSTWSEAANAVGASLGGIGVEVRSALGNPVQRAEARAALPVIVFYLIVVAILLIRGRRWMERLTIRTAEAGGPISQRFWVFLISLGQIGLPMIGLLALIEAATVSGFIGLRGAVLLEHLPYAGLLWLSLRWLGGRLFPKSDQVDAVVAVGLENRTEGRFYASLLGVVLGLAQLGQVLAHYEGYSDGAMAVLGLPFVLAAAVILGRIGQLAVTHANAEGDTPADPTVRAGIARLLGRAALAVAVAGPVLSMIGYSTAATALLFSSLLTFALLGFVLVLQRFAYDAYAIVLGRSEDTSDALIPVLLGILLALCALPVLALIWGARTADLTEIWTQFREGFSLGGTRISPTDFLTFVIIFTVGYMATRLLQGTLRSSVLPKTKMDVGGRNAVVSGVGYLGIFLAALIAVTSTGLDLSSLAIVAGALSVGIGFGLQNIVSNFVSGIILLIERPISEGDWIEVGGQMGYVRNISVRSTRIETFDRTDVIIPNADLVSGQVTNWTRGNSVGRVIVPVGVAYGTDPRKVEAILREIAEAHPMVLLNPPPNVVFQGFGADSLDFEIRAILRDVNWVLSVKSDMNYEIARRFEEEEIEIPFAQRDVWLRNPEALTGSSPSKDEA
jgi:small-conductance mechanosensitive channel